MVIFYDRMDVIHEILKLTSLAYFFEHNIW